VLRFNFIISVKIRGTRLIINLTESISHSYRNSAGMRGESKEHISRFYNNKKNRDDYYEERLQPKPDGVSRYLLGFCEHRVNPTTYGGIGVLYNCGGNGAVNRVWQPPGPEVIIALYY
jgi:hypothetical protein